MKTILEHLKKIISEIEPSVSRFQRTLLFVSIFMCSIIKINGQTAEKTLIEKELLAKARQNIEEYRKGDASLVFRDEQGKPIKNIRVEINQITQDFLFGNLCEEIFRLTPEDATKFEDKFISLFNFTELTVKWEPYEPDQGMPQWQKLQQKLAWCKKNNITPKGHTLGWTHLAGTPRWLMKYPFELANDLYKARIQNLVGGFKDQIKIWDVVNEPVNTIPWKMALADTLTTEGKIDDGTRYNVKGITLEQTIPWIEDSYKWAAEADKNGDFILNEFFLIAKPDIREKFYQLVKELQKKNTPINGIGIQAHEPRDMWFSPVELIKTYDRMNELGLPLHVTEFTPQSSGIPITGGWREGSWTEEAQADFAEQFYILSFGYPSMGSIHWWGLSDRMIWLKGGGLVDMDFNPKPVYTRLHKLIKDEWMTKNLLLKPDKNGQISFRGFYGSYQIKITKPDGSSIIIDRRLTENKDNQWFLKI
jgi:GH35 family endo-1,4-beta-xylanase